jgi:hypothetical protein
VSQSFKKYLLAVVLTIPLSVVGNHTTPYDDVADDSFIDTPTDDMLDHIEFAGDRKPAIPDGVKPTEQPVEQAVVDQLP